jgi:hypothetical protein
MLNNIIIIYLYITTAATGGCSFSLWERRCLPVGFLLLLLSEECG